MNNKSTINETHKANLCAWYIAMGADRDASQRGETYRKLRAIELRLERVMVKAANGELRYNDWLDNYPDLESALAYATNQVKAVFGTEPIGFFINHDPRGYALKIDDTVTATWRGTGLNPHRDFGGYGILAPELNR